MAVIIYSDPHLGLNLKANTTPASRARLQEHLYAHNTEILQRWKQPGDTAICCGDFYDKFSNPEEVLLKSLGVAQQTDLILAGNHDVSAVKDARGTLDVLGYVDPDKVVNHRFDRATSYWAEEDSVGISFCCIPHQTTQAIFEQALDREEAAVRRLTADPEEDNKVWVLLHCNYNSERAEQDTELNLTRQRAKQLFEAGAHRIVIGHEHDYRTDFNDRLIVLGNTHPTSFADIGEKYILVVNGPEDYERQEVWSPKFNYQVVDYTDLVDTMLEVRFLRVTGKAQPAELLQLGKDLKRVWGFCPDLFALRSDVEVDTGTQAQKQIRGMDAASLVDQIYQELITGQPEMAELWQEVTENVE